MWRAFGHICACVCLYICVCACVCMTGVTYVIKPHGCITLYTCMCIQINIHKLRFSSLVNLHTYIQYTNTRIHTYNTYTHMDWVLRLLLFVCVYACMYVCMHVCMVPESARSAHGVCLCIFEAHSPIPPDIHVHQQYGYKRFLKLFSSSVRHKNAFRYSCMYWLCHWDFETDGISHFNCRTHYDAGKNLRLVLCAMTIYDSCRLFSFSLYLF